MVTEGYAKAPGFRAGRIVASLPYPVSTEAGTLCNENKLDRISDESENGAGAANTSNPSP